MTEWIPTLLCGLAAFLMALGLTPWTIRLAPCIGALDVPRDERRMHTRPMPRTGGLALFVAFLVCVVACNAPLLPLLALLWGATLLLFLGIFDDVYRLPAGLKLIVQLIAAAVALGGGRPSALSMGTVFHFFINMLWVVLLINAHNMIDGLDGLAASISAVEAGMLAVVFTLQGNFAMASLALALAGACMGYLPYNRHPARVFMGDAGSQFLGLVLGVLSLHIDRITTGSLGGLVPLLVFALPLSDLAFAVLRRLLRGQSPFAADRGHWHHRLIDAGLGQRQVCFWMSLFSAALATVAILLCREDWYPLAVYAVLTVVALLLVFEVIYGRRRENAHR